MVAPARRHDRGRQQPVPQWMIDRILATDIEPYIGWTQARPWWDWNPWDALPHIDVPTLMIVGELEDPDDVMGEAATLLPDATRIQILGTSAKLSTAIITTSR